MNFEKPDSAEVILDAVLSCRDENNRLLCKYVVTEDYKADTFTVQLCTVSGRTTSYSFNTNSKNRKRIEAEISRLLNGESLH
jgi:hypothetical protein